MNVVRHDERRPEHHHVGLGDGPLDCLCLGPLRRGLCEATRHDLFDPLIDRFEERRMKRGIAILLGARKLSEKEPEEQVLDGTEDEVIEQLKSEQ